MSSHVGDKPGQVFSASVVVWLNIDDYRAASDHHLNVAQDALLLLQLCKQTKGPKKTLYCNMFHTLVHIWPYHHWWWFNMNVFRFIGVSLVIVSPTNGKNGCRAAVFLLNFIMTIVVILWQLQLFWLYKAPSLKWRWCFCSFKTLKQRLCLLSDQLLDVGAKTRGNTL